VVQTLRTRAVGITPRTLAVGRESERLPQAQAVTADETFPRAPPAILEAAATSYFASLIPVICQRAAGGKKLR
jgi:hypothetical protein